MAQLCEVLSQHSKGYVINVNKYIILNLTNVPSLFGLIATICGAIFRSKNDVHWSSIDHEQSVFENISMGIAYLMYPYF